MYTDEEKSEKIDRLFRCLYLKSEPSVDLRKAKRQNIDVHPPNHYIPKEEHEEIIDGWVEKHHKKFGYSERKLKKHIMYMILNKGPSVR